MLDTDYFRIKLIFEGNSEVVKEKKGQRNLRTVCVCFSRYTELKTRLFYLNLLKHWFIYRIVFGLKASR